jgi:hypothetical protein
LVEQVRSITGRERAMSGQQLVKNHPQAVDIRAGIYPMALAARLLWTHVWRSPGKGRPHTIFSFTKGDAEVRNIGPAFSIDEDVGRLDVAMDDIPLVGIMERLGYTNNDRQRRCPARAAAAEVSTEVLTLD